MTLINQAFKGTNGRKPVWLMRQAGRYLPAYQATRKQAGSFFGLCDTPNLAAEVTLQPIRQFNFDAAIIFSDILVIPRAMGVDVKFTDGEGPSLSLIKNEEDIANLSTHHVLQKTAPTLEALKLVRASLDPEKELIGFCGAPWTIAMYMMEKSPAKGALNLGALYYTNPKAFKALQSKIVEASASYLCAQIEAGAGCLQIFDSWAGQAPHGLFKEGVETPLLDLCKKVKEKHPEVPLIIFPRAVGEEKLKHLASQHLNVFDGMGLDYCTNVKWALENLPKSLLLQGNLDPSLLLSTPQNVEKEVKNLLEITRNRPNFIVNLGHGITPAAKVENVAALAAKCLLG